MTNGERSAGPEARWLGGGFGIRIGAKNIVVMASRTKTESLRRALLGWFDRNRRDLPWRRPDSYRDDPYRIWLAETMLQQTRVPVVIPYYRRFLRVFPTLRRLATARRERVLAAWAGLGYYQRARNLHRAAKTILSRHRGRFPDSLEAALRLPGIGPYTARAILSIAYGQPHAVVDGNVARVLARVFRIRLADSQAARAKLQPLADRLVSPRRPGDFNQALMELGSTICLPRLPRCAACPLARVCAARRAGIENSWPPRTARRPRPRRRLAVLVLRRHGRLLVTRERRGLFSGLWHFPYASRRNGRSLPPSLVALVARFRARLDSRQPIVRIRHPMTAGDLDLSVYVGAARRDGSLPGARWVSPHRLQEIGVSAGTRKIAEALRGDVHSVYDGAA